jgi:SAM-dependent methyltransferase
MHMKAKIPGSRWPRFEPGDCSEEDLQALCIFLAGYAVTLGPPADPRINLFRHCFYTRETEFPADALRLLERLGLIASDNAPPGLIYSTAAILRVAGELIVCDRGGAPDYSDYPLPPDSVYPPIFDNVMRYLASLPSTSCDCFLELGTGTGIAAIQGARHAQHVWATDIVTRSVEFARLNCRLAGLDNVTVLEGDLCHPVEGLTFDRIAIHPPWAPSWQSSFVFADGGDDGETILRRTIEGLPRVLRRGGRFYAHMSASDREGEPFEQRVRRWLGAGHSEFHVALRELSCTSTDEFLAQNLARGSIAQPDVPLWRELWKATRAEALFYGDMIVERCGEARKPVSVRIATGDLAGRRLEEVLDSEAPFRT